MENIYDKLENSLWKSTNDFIESVGMEGDVRAIISHQSGLEPRGDYVAINVIHLNDIGSAWKSSVASSGSDKTTMQIHNGYEALVGFRFHGDGVGLLAQQLDTMIKNSEQTRWLYQLEGLSPLNKTSLRRIPVLKETKWHNAFSLDVTFTYILLTEESVGWVDKVGIHNLTNDDKSCVSLTNKENCEE